MLKRDNTTLVVIDVQGKLAGLMHDRAELFANLRRMIQGAKVLDLPIVVTEQYPEGIGPTVPEIAEVLPKLDPISKICFSCCGADEFTTSLRSLNRKQVLVTGIETHICVMQTVLDLLDTGYDVQVVADAVSSRTADNKRIGLERMRDAGAVITSTESALYELLGVASGTEFRAVLKLIK